MEDRNANPAKIVQEEYKDIIAQLDAKAANAQASEGKTTQDADKETQKSGCDIFGEIMRDNLEWIENCGMFNPEQKTAARMIGICKTAELGGYIEYCPDCKTYVGYHYASCGNRNCPRCQAVTKKKWVEERKSETIPGCHYYHCTLTVPHMLNPLIEANGTTLLNLVLSCSGHAVVDICRDPKYLGATPGVVSVLHTWQSDLSSKHFHSHMIVSGGGLDKNGKWVTLQDVRKGRKVIPSRGSGDTSCESADAMNETFYFFPVAAVTDLFRGKFVSELNKLYTANVLVMPATQQHLADPANWADFIAAVQQEKWVGHLNETAVHGEKGIEILGIFTMERPANGAEYAKTEQEETLPDAFDYLGNHINNTGISPASLISYDKAVVQFVARDRDSADGKKIVKMPVHDFITRYLSHVLPKSFTRVRSYGFLSNGHKNKNLTLIMKQLNKTYTPSPLKKMSVPELVTVLFPDLHHGVCPLCGGKTTTYAFGQVLRREAFCRKNKSASEIVCQDNSGGGDASSAKNPQA